MSAAETEGNNIIHTCMHARTHAHTHTQLGVQWIQVQSSKWSHTDIHGSLHSIKWDPVNGDMSHQLKQPIPLLSYEVTYFQRQMGTARKQCLYQDNPLKKDRLLALIRTSGYVLILCLTGVARLCPRVIVTSG